MKAFQTYVNKNYKAKLTVDGICGPATFKYLDNYSIAVNPSPSATAGPDNGTISADSSPVRIRELQLKLIAMGWLDGEATGKYDNATYNAVMAFQNYVNVSTSSSLLTVNVWPEREHAAAGSATSARQAEGDDRSPPRLRPPRPPSTRTTKPTF